MSVLDRPAIETDIAETSAELERLRSELAEFPFHLRESRLFLGKTEERRRLLKRLDLLRQLVQVTPS